MCLKRQVKLTRTLTNNNPTHIPCMPCKATREKSLRTSSSSSSSYLNQAKPPELLVRDKYDNVNYQITCLFYSV